MKKQLLSIIILIAYSALLVKVMIFKDVPAIKSGVVTLDFGGINGDHPANLVPFKTILPYVLGDKGVLIGGLNLIGNIALLVPLGFLAPFIYGNMTWKKSLIIAIASGLAIEIAQTLLRVGIFDIDDVILNGFGVMLGYWTFTTLASWFRSRKYKTILFAASTILMLTTAVFTYFGVSFYQESHRPMNSVFGTADFQSDQQTNQETAVPQSGDLCGGTSGTGEIVSTGNNTITITSKAGKTRVIELSDQTTIKNSAGALSASDLKVGDQVTIVIYDGNVATAVLVCK